MSMPIPEADQNNKFVAKENAKAAADFPFGGYAPRSEPNFGAS